MDDDSTAPTADTKNALDDLDATRAQLWAERDPAWVAKYGQASWDAAMVVLGETPADSGPSDPAVPDSGNQPSDQD